MADPEMKISRPRQIYMGNTITDYVPIDQRRNENGNS
jgi:citrate synthase